MKLKDGFVMKKIANEYVVVPIRRRAMEFNAVIKLTESGAMLWQKLESGAESDELISALLDEYDVDEARAAADVERFLLKLRDADILEG